MTDHLKISKGRKKSFLKVPVGFLDYYLPTVNGDYLKIYLYGLRLCCDNKSLTDEEIAQKLGFLKADVANAWAFWEQEGLITVFDDGTIEFENLEDITFLKNKTVKSKKNDKDFDEIVGRNSEFHHVIRTVEALYKEFLTQNDVLLIYDVIENKKVPLDLFVITMTHCIAMNKKSIAYISKVVTQCFKNGYTTTEALEEYFSKNDENNKLFRKYKKILKIYNRELIDKEKEFILNWLSAKKSEDEIKAAFEVTVLNTGKLSFPYMNKILTDSSPKKSAIPSEKAANLKPGPLNNFSHGSIPDFNKITDQLMKKQKQV